MKKLLLPAAALALVSLAACENKPTEVTSTSPDPNAAELAKRKPVELPPMMTSEVTFRCKDQSVVIVDFFQGEKQVLIKPEKEGSITKLTAEKAGDPYKLEGYELKGDKSGITLTQPGKPAQACKA
ncbi:hypothetical protein PX554_13370 [Sphingomonas sp. H39-1-10]|uniref:hypothetical protein n=1 Tax=Sphingomonas TaxID=13687 RepID=UPI00088A5A4F|nr:MULTISPECIES: hypothetical protein [Sphingomonas]MDF0489127.1 hypothetical protein [Sphingomonas pollutisoli]SDA20945.1 hypothetical protein SAMN03159340_01359 [Sphingomonas sp. NFR15]